MSYRSKHTAAALIGSGLLLACQPRPTHAPSQVGASVAESEARSEAPAVFIEAPEDPALEARAHAEPDADAPSAAPRASEPSVDPDVERVAKQHYQAGTKYFEAHDFAAALAQFQQAYSLLPLPALQYNIAHCHEELGQVAAACAAYAALVERGDEYLRDAAKRARARLAC